MTMETISKQDEDVQIEIPSDLESQLQEAESRIADFVWTTATAAKSAMKPRLERYERFIKRYRGEPTVIGGDSPFDRVDPPKLAALIDILKAQTMQTLIPDRQRLDFFELIPQLSSDFDPANPQMEQFASLATYAIRNDLINAHFIEEFEKCVWDYHALGTMMLLAEWELNICYKYQKVENPEYLKHGPFRVDEVNGVDVPTMIDQYVTARIPYRKFDAPKLRYLNPRNVFPTEMDRHNYMDCSGVVIYDTVRLRELREEAIESGGAFFANTGPDKLKFSDETENNTEVAEVGLDSQKSFQAGHCPGIRSLDRYTYIGNFYLDEVLDGMEITDALLAALAEKFGMDKTKMEDWNTWYVSVVNSGGVLVRCQPSAYFVDEKPIIQICKHAIPSRTNGEGTYDRCIEDERSRNSFRRYQQENALLAARPPVMLIQEAMDERWLLSQQGSIRLRPNMAVQGKVGHKIGEAFQILKVDTTPVQMGDQIIQGLDNEILTTLNLMPVSGGVGGANDMKLGQQGDLIQEENALHIEIGFLNRAISWLLLLHHQYTDSAKPVWYYTDEGDRAFQSVPPEVWANMYDVNLIGFRQTGNLAMRAMNFNEFYKAGSAKGYINEEEALKYYGKLLGVKFPERMIQTPQPQPFVKMNVNLNAPIGMLPQEVQADVFKDAGIPWSEESLQQAGLYRAYAKQAAQMEAGQESAAQEQSLMESNGGSPPGVKEATVGNQGQNLAEGSHHAPGEVEQRQRALHDEEGANRAVAQTMRDPANSRRAGA